jgi:hypothetical protein
VVGRATVDDDERRKGGEFANGHEIS